MFLCFFALGFLVMSTEIFSSGIDLDGRFLSVFVYDCLVTFLAFASFFFDPKDLIVTSFIPKGGLNRRQQVLHRDLRFFVMRLGRRDTLEAYPPTTPLRESELHT